MATNRKEYEREYKKKNKLEIKRKSALWYQKNKVRHKAKSAAWVRNNKEKSKAIKLAWKARHPERRLLHSAKMRARIYKVPFDLIAADITVPTHCPVLGIKLKWEGSGRAKADCPSLDRFVPELGYVRGNVNVISWRANWLKRDGCLEEFVKLVAYMTSRTANLSRNQIAE